MQDVAVGLQYAVGPTAGLAGYGESSFVLDMSRCLSSDEAICVGPRCPFEVVVGRQPRNLKVNALPGMYSAM
jgi:hypothetical protein